MSSGHTRLNPFSEVTADEAGDTEVVRVDTDAGDSSDVTPTCVRLPKTTENQMGYPVTIFKTKNQGLQIDGLYLVLLRYLVHYVGTLYALVVYDFSRQPVTTRVEMYFHVSVLSTFQVFFQPAFKF